MIHTEPSGNSPVNQQAWSLSAALIAATAVASTIGVLAVAYLFAVAGGETGTRLVAIVPIYFIAVFALVFGIFWTLRALVAFLNRSLGDGVMGTPEYGAVVLLTFLAVSLLQYTQKDGLSQSERAARGEAGVSAAELREADPAARLQAAQSARLRPDAYTVLLRDADPRVRLALAARPDLPAGLMEFLADDRLPEVRVVVGASPKTDDETLMRLAYDRDERVRIAVAANPRVSPSALEILGSGTSHVRRAVAANPRTPRETLTLLARDDDPVVARAAGSRLQSAR